MALLPIPDLGPGLNLDGAPEELALGVSSAGANMRFRAGFAERFKGMAAVYTTPLVTPYHIAHYTVGTTRNVVYAGIQKTYADDGTTQTDITNANNTGGIGDRWCGFVFNGVYVQNNGVDAPQFWGGSTGANLADLTAWPLNYKAGFLRPFKNYLVAGDVTRAGTRERGTILWSHIADPGTIPTSWDISDATKDAGDVSLSETNGTLIDALPLGDMNVIYKDDSLYYQQSIGSVQIFRFGRLPGDTGLLARGCVVSIPPGHVYLTPGFDVVLHNGQGPQSIIDGKMRTWLRNNLNAAMASRSFLAANPSTNEVLVCFPSDAFEVCTKALVWNWKDNTFGIRELSNVTYGSTGQVTLASSTDTWAGDTETWAEDSSTWGESDYAPNTPRLIFTRTTPGLAMFDATGKDFGVDFTATMERTGLHFDAPTQVKLCRGVRPVIDGPMGATVYVQIGAAMFPDQAPVWQTASAFTIGTDIETFAFASGRFLSIRFYSTANLPWRIRSCQMDVIAQGGY
jgi:hypothetical protein